MQYEYEKFCHAAQLQEEIDTSSITKELDSIQTSGNLTIITFLSNLSNEEKITLDTLVNNHIPVYPEIPTEAQPVAIQNTEIDEQGRQVNRIAAASKGWTYLAHPIEFETAKIGSLYEKDKDGNNKNTSSIKFYDSNNTEVTDAQNEANIVKTVILFKPSYDYELIAGNLQQIDSPSTDVRLWVIGGLIELGGAYVKEFAGGLNMRYYGANESVKTDGRAAKYMRKDIPGVPYQGNQLQIIVKHNAGVQHKLMLTLEYFRA